MSRPLLERRLSDVAGRLRKLRDDLAVAEEQLRHFRNEEDEARLRALVAEAPVAEREHREAARATAAMARHRDHLVTEIAGLERSQDELLDQMLAAGEGR